MLLPVLNEQLGLGGLASVENGAVLMTVQQFVMNDLYLTL